MILVDLKNNQNNKEIIEGLLPFDRTLPLVKETSP